MARAIRWQVPFTSLNGTQCRVDIYQEDWEGGITVLSEANVNAPAVPAANPFEYEENNDEDTLNNVIRYRTGYLTLVEKEYGGLSDIYPAVNTDRYIEFYYGETLDFVGYIQAQAFELGWEPGPREIKLPIISPLGLAGGTYYDWQNYNPPRWITLQAAISASFDILGGNYTRYIFPQIISSSLGKVVNGLYINSLLLTPWGNQYYKDGSSLEGIYEPVTVEDVLTMICTTFGLILHDVPGTPVFQRLDWNGDYMNRATGNDYSNTPVSPAITDLTAIAEVDSADNTESIVLPFSRIEITRGGDEPNYNMTFDTCRGYLAGCALPDYSAAYNQPNIADFTGTYDILSIDSDGKIEKGKISLAAFGQGGLTEAILYRSNSWPTRTLVATITIYDWIGESCKLSFKHTWGTSVADMKSEGFYNNYPPVGVLVKTGSYYFSTTSLWQPLPSGFTGYTSSWQDDTTECIVSITPFYSDGPQPLVIEIYAWSVSWQGQVYTDSWVQAINNLRIEPSAASAFDAYIGRNQDKSIIVTGEPSIEKSSVERGLSLMEQTTHCMRMGTTITGADQNEVKNYPRYPHLLTAQKRLQVDLAFDQRPDNIELYTNRLALWQSGDNWKVIARAFTPWDDRENLTLHSSEVFND